MTDQASAVSRTVRTARQSRRHVLAAGTGALAAMAADAIARPVPADAAGNP